LIIEDVSFARRNEIDYSSYGVVMNKSFALEVMSEKRIENSNHIKPRNTQTQQFCLSKNKLIVEAVSFSNLREEMRLIIVVMV
jgi:hypothetical protein